MTEDQRQQLEDQQKQVGDRGEDFALRYERQRLQAHHRVSEVSIIGHKDVAMGYDIISFMGVTSTTHDRYIEVKTYSGTPHFFLSAGEQAAATRLGSNYFLYLVDLNSVDKPGYEPLIIQDPIHNLDGKWQEKIQNREFVFTDAAHETLPDDLDSATVLVGCFRSNEHLNWILRNRAYNVRSSIINGAVRRDEVTTDVRYLLLYSVREPRTYRVYTVSGLRTVSRSDMLRMRYPDPHAREYILYQLTEQIQLPLIDIMQILRTYNDKLHRTSGTPIFLSGKALKAYMPSQPHPTGTAPSRIYTNEGKPWSADQKARLEALYLSGTTIAALAHILMRDTKEITTQLKAQHLLP